MRVAILGGGLSAAYAWRACLDAGITPAVYATRLFVPPGGFVYAHWLPKSVNKRSLWEDIHVQYNGTAEGYTSKMWNTSAAIASSFGKEVFVRGVNPLVAARALWGDRNKLREQLSIMNLRQEDVDYLASRYDVLIQTFPLAKQEEKYHTPIWVLPHKANKNEVVYDGDYKHFWTRGSQLFNFLSYEFPPVRKCDESYIAQLAGEEILRDNPKAKLWYAPEIPPLEIAAKTRIEEYSDGKILYCGRWATGNRKALSHEAYQRTASFIKERM